VPRRGNFPTVADPSTAIERFMAAWNDSCQPFTRTKDRHRPREGDRPAEKENNNQVHYGALAEEIGGPLLVHASGMTTSVSVPRPSETSPDRRCP
jgi:hypothetical protein